MKHFLFIASLIFSFSAFGQQGVAQRATNGFGYGTTTMQKVVATNYHGNGGGISNVISATNAFNFFNVKQYGALGTGAGDDTDEIQTAIDAADARGGGVVYFPDGVYTVKKNSSNYYNGCLSLSTNFNNITFLGESQAGVIISNIAHYTTNCSVVYVRMSTNFVMKNLTIDGGWTLRGGAPADTSENEGVSMSLVTNVLISDVTFRNSGADGLDIDDGWNVQVYNCIALTNGGAGFALAGGNVELNGLLTCYNGGAKLAEGVEPDIGGLVFGAFRGVASDIICASNYPVNAAFGYNPGMTVQNITTYQPINSATTNLWLYGTLTEFNLSGFYAYGGEVGLVVTHGIGAGWVPDPSATAFPTRVTVSDGHFSANSNPVRIIKGNGLYFSQMIIDNNGVSTPQHAVQISSPATNVVWDGGSIEQYGVGMLGITLTNAHNTIIRNAKIGMLERALYPIGFNGHITNCTLENLTLGRSGSGSISIPATATATVSNNIYRNLVCNGGVDFYGGNNIIQNCVFGKNGAANSYVYFAPQSAANTSTNNILTGNVFPFYHPSGATIGLQNTIANYTITNLVYFPFP